jgi:hypothetical protein
MKTYYSLIEIFIFNWNICSIWKTVLNTNAIGNDAMNRLPFSLLCNFLLDIDTGIDQTFKSFSISFGSKAKKKCVLQLLHFSTTFLLLHIWIRDSWML